MTVGKAKRQSIAQSRTALVPRERRRSKRPMDETEAKDRSVMEARIRSALEEFKPSGGSCKTKWLWPREKSWNWLEKCALAATRCICYSRRRADRQRQSYSRRDRGYCGRATLGPRARLGPERGRCAQHDRDCGDWPVR